MMLIIGGNIMLSIVRKLINWLRIFNIDSVVFNILMINVVDIYLSFLFVSFLIVLIILSEEEYKLRLLIFKVENIMISKFVFFVV